MGVRIEQFDDGEVLYVALDPDGTWARSEFPDELITVDYNAQGAVIGVELLGSVARAGAHSLLAALVEAEGLDDPPAVKDALSSILP